MQRLGGASTDRRTSSPSWPDNVGNTAAAAEPASQSGRGPVLPEVEQDLPRGCDSDQWSPWAFFVSVYSSAITAMFSERLSALLALIGVAVAAVQLPVKESDSISGIPADNQVPLQYSTQPEVANAWVDHPFDTDPLQPKFEPVGELSAVGSDQWTTLHHPVFPRYSVRIKQSRFCDTTVK